MSGETTLWKRRISAQEDRRCDLEVILADEWRHRIAIRDSESEFTPTTTRSFTLDPKIGAATPDRDTLRAALVLAQHLIVRAYGHGHVSVVAVLDIDRGSSGQDVRLWPHILDHDADDAASVGSLIERIRADLSGCPGLAPEELLGAGHLDALLDLRASQAVAVPMPLTTTADLATAGPITAELAVAAQLIPDAVLHGMADVAQRVAEQVLTGPGRILREVDLASAEHERTLRAWTDTAGEFDRTIRLEQLFSAAARRTPDACAISFAGKSTTYRELEEQSSWLGHWLAGDPVVADRGDLVGLLLDKSAMGCIATLGIWKSGAAYVPIDPGYPDERIRFLLADAGLRAVVTSTEHVERVRSLAHESQTDLVVVDLAEVLGARPDQIPDGAVRSDLVSTDLAYVTYTSGTTGTPKGVPKEHTSVVNSITDLSQRYGMQSSGTERIALYASYVFEPHLRQTLLALLNNHTLVIVPEQVRLDPDRFPQFLREERVTYLNATGSVLAHFDLSGCTDLRRLHLVGEELTSAGLTRLRSTYDGLVVNEYAFTEAAFVTAIKEFEPGVRTRTDRSIGRPVRGVTWYVLSQNGKPLPIGAIGELYIGGCGVAPGYLNRPDLTAERFSDNPFQTPQERNRGDNGRLYRTGDLARFLPNGEVEFMGRSDFQLKINGVRVEPGEIQAHALECPGVALCVVVARSGVGEDLQLVGYYICEPGHVVEEDTLVDFLEQRVIRAMVPARMVAVDQIPVNVNGKPDWRALPEPPPLAALAAPAGAVEESGTLDALREIWSEVLGIASSRIDADADFFRLGGQSITAILVVSRVRARLNRSVAVEDVFRARTLSQLAEHLRTAAPIVDGVADREAVDGYGPPLTLPATGLQQGLLYHALKRTDPDDAYVMQSVHRYSQPIDAERMRAAWQHARRTYPALRLRFQVGEQAQQVIDRDDEQLEWRFVDLSGLTPGSAAQRVQEIQRADRARPYDPAQGKLFRVYLFEMAPDLYTVLFGCHHIILDGWSLPVLHDAVHRAYLALVDGEELTVEPDTAYVAAQRWWHEHREDHLDYWNARTALIDDRGDLGGLITRRQRYRVALGEYDRVREHRTRSLRLSDSVMAGLREVCAEQQVTMHSLLQFVWHEVLRTVGGGNTTVVGTIVSGRGVPVRDIESSVGLYINTLPMVVDHDEQSPQSVADALRTIQRDVNDMNTYSGVDLGRLNHEARGRIFDTLLVLENYPDALAETEAVGRLAFEKDYDADKVDYPIAVVAR